MIRAIQDLSEEALNAVAAMERTAKKAEQNAREIFTEATKVVLATVNPVKVSDNLDFLHFNVFFSEIPCILNFVHRSTRL